jgi:FixJ family two-component response regulator
MSSAQSLTEQLALWSVPNSVPIVFVVDNDLSARRSLEHLVSREGWQFETFESPRELLAESRPLGPNCLVLNLSILGPAALEVQKRIARERSEMQTIVVSDREDLAMTVQAIKAGAVDFLLKPFSYDSLLSAIREGIRRSAAALQREMNMRNLRDRYLSLSGRERQVMELVVSGLLNKQIGGELGISEITVKAHRGQVMQKMKANSLADLVRMAVKLWPEQQPIHLA